MIEFLFAYGLFLAKVVTGLLALVLVIAIIAGSRKREDSSELKVTHLNDKFDALKKRLQQALMSKKDFKELTKTEAKEAKKKAKGKTKEATDETKPRLFVLEFEGDIKASEVVSLRDEITAVLSVADKGDEVLLKLENAGGIVHEHGLAASQLKRIKDAGLRLTISVDKVAASGGYMMACIADKIVAAPFAILGSVGVIAQLPNFNRLLDKAGIDFEQHTAGDFKRTLTMFGKNSNKERAKLKEELEETHVLFQNFVSEHRPQLNMAEIATGEHWYGTKALELKLVDELITSDQLLIENLDSFDLYQIEVDIKQGLQEKLLGGFLGAIESAKLALVGQRQDQRYK
ncbi:MAG: protease SohB [Pseudomonadota bacterium]